MKRDKWFRFYVQSGDNCRSETLAILCAADDSAATAEGFRLLEEAELLTQKRENYDVPADDAEDEEERGFFSCVEIESEADLEAALDGIPALGELSGYTFGIASVTWPAMMKDAERPT